MLTRGSNNKKRELQVKGASVIEIEYSPEYERRHLRHDDPPQPRRKRNRSSKKRKRMYQRQQQQDQQEPPTKKKNTKYPSYNLPYPKINKEAADQLKKNKTAQYNNNGQTTYKPYQIKMREQNVKSSVVVNKEIGYPMLLTKWIVSNSNGLVDESSIPSHIGIENHMIHSITYTKEMMLTDKEEDTFIKCKLLLKQSRYHKELCSKLSGSAILEDSNMSYVRYLPNGKFDLVVLRNVNDDSTTTVQWPIELQYHKDTSRLYAKTCNAAPYVTYHDAVRMMKDEDVLGGYGVRGAKSIDKICTKTAGSAENAIIHWTNKDGKKVKRAISGAIDFNDMSHTQTEKQIERSSVIHRNYTLFKLICPAFFNNYELSEDISTELQDELDTTKHKRSATNLADNENRPTLLVHTDPRCGYPTAVCGPTTYEVHQDSWIHKCGGGELILLNGWHYIDYSPNDLVLISPDTLHGVSTLSCPNGMNQSLSRYSHTMTCKFKRGRECNLDLTSYKK